jgi:glycyl-tRNA synthetase beta chain
VNNNTFILEIGTEELPSLYVMQAREQILDNTERIFFDKDLQFDEIKSFSTPRRIILVVSGLPSEKSGGRELVKGPPYEISFDDKGNPTKASIGFAKNSGIKVNDLIVKEQDGREFVFAEKVIPPEKTEKILQEVSPEIIKSLKFAKTMRWDSSEETFPRPIRWLFALFDDRIIQFSYAGVSSSNYTFGHRLIADNRKIVVDKVNEYFKKLTDAGVIFSHSDRLELVRCQIEKNLPEATRPELVSELDRIVDTLEHPTVIIGSFDEKHLELPDEVIKSALMGYQDFLPIRSKSGLYPGFLGIHDGRYEASEKILVGYERAIKSRLEDASYFYIEDIRSGIDTYKDRLDGILFIEGLGTMEDKAKRLKLILQNFATLVPEEFLEKDLIGTAMLCKADLASLMIQEKEFSNLEGIMGGYYAESSGYSKEISRAIKEHYKPKGIEDLPPESPLGRLAGIADKLDTIVGAFYLGMKPSGSEDPFALRRSAIGIIMTILDIKEDELTGVEPWSFNIEKLITIVENAYEKVNGLDVSQEHSSIVEFIERRFLVIMKDRGIRYDIAHASIGEMLTNMLEIVRRAKGLQSIVDIPDFDAVAGGFKRIINIVRQGRDRDLEWGGLDEKLFKQKEEREFYKRFKEIKETVNDYVSSGDYSKAFRELAYLRSDVDTFFDEVLVMCDDEELRNNRLALMEEIGSYFLTLADFTRIVIE